MSGSNGEIYVNSPNPTVEEVATVSPNKRGRPAKAKSIEVIDVAGEVTTKKSSPKKTANGVKSETKTPKKSGRKAKVSVSFAGTDKNGDNFVVLKVPKSLSLAASDIAELVNR